MVAPYKHKQSRCGAARAALIRRPRTGRRNGHRRVGVAGFAGVASGSTSMPAVLGLRTAVVAGWAWLASPTVHLYRRTALPP